MLRGVYTKLLTLMLFITFGLSLNSCDDKNEKQPGEEGLITLKVLLPEGTDQNVVPVETRGGTAKPGTSEESRISTLKFFIYNNSGSLEVYKSIVINSDGTSTDPMWDSANKALRIPVTVGSKQIYCVANWKDQNAEGMPVLDNISAASTSDLLGLVRTHTNLTPDNPPVMTGYSEATLIGGETSLSIKITRQIARVELAFKLSDELNAIGTSNIVITGVKFLKLPSASYLFPKSPIASPPSITTWGQSTFTGVNSNVLTGTATVYPTLYYIPEYTPSAANATTMVLRATYNGTATYYNVVLNPAESSMNGTYGHTPYAIERNHTYQYTITIEGLGNSTVPTRSIDSGSVNITYSLKIK